VAGLRKRSCASTRGVTPKDKPPTFHAPLICRMLKEWPRCCAGERSRSCATGDGRPSVMDCRRKLGLGHVLRLQEEHPREAAHGRTVPAGDLVTLPANAARQATIFKKPAGGTLMSPSCGTDAARTVDPGGQDRRADEACTRPPPMPSAAGANRASGTKKSSGFRWTGRIQDAARMMKLIW